MSDPMQSRERALGECYRLLAACFYPPQKALWLEENLLGSLAGALERICPSTEEPIRRMQEAFSDSSAEDLMVEHARLFIGPQRVVASPYGSVYLEEGRRVMGDSTLDALQAYQEAGLHLDPDFKELPDHIAVELEFSYYLTAKALEADASHHGDEAAQRRAAREAFLDRHLRRWVPPFCAAICEGTAHPFYRSLAEGLKTFIADRPAQPAVDIA
jgi:TorA maturation chaperone TorD